MTRWVIGYLIQRSLGHTAQLIMRQIVLKTTKPKEYKSILASKSGFPAKKKWFPTCQNKSGVYQIKGMYGYDCIIQEGV